MSAALRAAILAACDALEAARERLCALDAPNGDGDHGVTMAIGARNVRRGLEAVEGDDPARLVRTAAMSAAGMGGAIGPLYGRGLLAVAAELQAAGDTPADSVALLRRCATAASEAVVALGHAAPGDKTILDALLPVEAALADAEAQGGSVPHALEAARHAADEGAQATVGMVATVGRAARFGERSRGSADPGATSFALIVDALVASTLASPGPAIEPAAGPAAAPAEPT